ncbi:MAG: hypothetical protein ACI94Y_003779 [Maribacter sp.]
MQGTKRSHSRPWRVFVTKEVVKFIQLCATFIIQIGIISKSSNMKNLFLLFFLFIGSTSLFSQEDYDRTFADGLIVGSSFTYIRYGDSDIKYKYHELTTNVNLAIPIYKNIYAGLSFLNINTISSQIGVKKTRNRYYMAGAFAQYDFLKKRKDRLIGEISYHYGNYCLCGKEDPYKSSNLSYFGFGGSYDWHIIQGLYLDMGFNVHTIINKRERKDIFAQYILGLNYHIAW